jgi:LmbE family N-acetylglucosaminyl deacetylase
MSNSKKTILILAPHTDDGELGCGGFISKMIEEGATVYYAAFSLCKRSLSPGLEPDTLEKEVKKATLILGIQPGNLILYDYDVRRFNDFRQDILENMIELKTRIKPDLVLVPSPADIHQDHQVISAEGLRAFKNISILGYELPWNNVSFNTHSFVQLEKRHVQKKIDALVEYQSQSYRKYLNSEFITALAITRGVQIGYDYAEAFEVIRWII